VDVTQRVATWCTFQGSAANLGLAAAMLDITHTLKLIMLQMHYSKTTAQPQLHILKHKLCPVVSTQPNTCQICCHNVPLNNQQHRYSMMQRP
jgi:hypothetical protein